MVYFRKILQRPKPTSSNASVLGGVLMQSGPRCRSTPLIFKMPRAKGAIWKHFIPVDRGDYETDRVECFHCKKTISATVARMLNHISTCPSMTRSVGRLTESLEHSSGRSVATSTVQGAASAAPQTSQDDSHDDRILEELIDAEIVDQERLSSILLGAATLASITNSHLYADDQQ